MIKAIENAVKAYEPVRTFESKINVQIQLADMLVAFEKIPSEANLEGEEQRVKFDISELWFEYSFLSKRVIYHMKNYINSIDSLIEYLNAASFVSVGLTFTLPDYIANSIAFEFESFISAFFKLTEVAVTKQILQKLKGSIKNDFPSDLIDRENVDGLYWTLNILRNRVVHPYESKYTIDDNNACRFTAFSSKPFALQINEEKLVLKCNLFYLNENPIIKKIIKSEIIEKGDKKIPIMDMIFPMNSPSGHSKRSPYVVSTVDDIKLFDYINSFTDLGLSLLDYMNKINHLFVREITKNFKKEQMEQTYCIEMEEFKIKDVFQL